MKWIVLWTIVWFTPFNVIEESRYGELTYEQRTDQRYEVFDSSISALKFIGSMPGRLGGCPQDYCKDIELYKLVNKYILDVHISSYVGKMHIIEQK